MALSDLRVYHDEAYGYSTELLNERVQVFNAATNNGIMLDVPRAGANNGSFNTRSFWNKVTTTRRRNAFAMTAISDQVMTMNDMSTVKIAAGTPRVLYEKGDIDWMTGGSGDRDAALVAFAQQLAIDRFADMLSRGIAAYTAAVTAVATNFLNVSALTLGNELFSPRSALTAKQRLGDAQTRVVAWLVNSKQYNDFLLGNLTNPGTLFTWETVNVVRDVTGTPIIITDLLPMVAGSPNTYNAIGLTSGAIVIQQNADYQSTAVDITGLEQIRTAFQAQWSYNLGIKGFTWDRVNGGPSPTNAAIATATNWDRVSTDFKDLAGVVLRTQ